MGGGHVTRPGFAVTGPDPAYPLTEFYLILQKALAHGRSFALPGAYVKFSPPANTQLYAEDVRDYCVFSAQKAPGFLEIFPPSRLNILYDDLQLKQNGIPSALLLAWDGARRTTAVQLLPPFPLEELPSPPDQAYLLTVQLTGADVLLADADPKRLGARLADAVENKCWLAHPKIDQWLTRALSAAQRDYRRQAPRPWER